MTDTATSSTVSPAAAADATPSRSAATFEVLPLSRELRETLAEIGYVHPTPVQLAVWEPATRGQDAVVQARTGTGKTAAFGLPIVDHLVRRSMAQVQVLALTPTRELALQVAREIERLGKRKNVKVTAIYGGAPMQRQIDEIADGAQVIVGTPGRVLDHLRRGTLDPKHVRLLVLDEADEMLSMGFEREVTAILESLPKERQTLLFSATLPPDIERMAKKLRQPEYVTLSGDHVGALSIEHFVYFVASDKIGALTRVIDVENPESAVVFCNTKDETERVAQALSRQGYDADWLNGDLPQSDRERVMANTREGRLRFLVATDVAARGIDISHLTHVINYDFPQDAESYVHRTGRTGRAGRTGTAISLITPQDVGGLYLLRLTYKIRPIEKQIPSEGEIKTRAEADLVSMLIEAFTGRPIHADDLALARRLLTHEQSESIVAGLLRDHLGARPDAQRTATTARKATRTPPKPAAVAAPKAPSVAPKPVEAPKVEAPAPKVEPVVAKAEPIAPKVEPIAAEAPKPVAAAEAPAAVIEERPRGDQPRDDRGERRPRFEGDRGPRGRGRERDRDRDQNRGPDQRRAGRAREGYVPVSAAEGTHEGHSSVAPTRHADFTSWQPPEEEGDDEPILGGGALPPGAEGERRGEQDRRGEGERREQDRRGDRRRNEGPRPAPAVAVAEEGGIKAGGGGWSPEAAPEADVDLAEIYVNVGRREGARAADFQRILTERAGIDKANVRRIRVRERNAFVSVRREDLTAAVTALTGAMIAGKTASAEQARERGAEGDAPDAARPQPVVEDAAIATAPQAPAQAEITQADVVSAPVVPAAEAAPSGEEAVTSDAVPTGRSGG